MIKNERYLGELSPHLHVRGVGEDRIKGIIGEVEAHLEDAGEDPLEAFGPASEYAE